MRIFVFVFVLSLLLSCDNQSVVFSGEYTFEDNDWDRNEEINFNFSVNDKENPYKISLIFNYSKELEAKELRFQTKLQNQGEKRIQYYNPKIKNFGSADTVIISNQQYFNSSEEYKFNIKNLSHKIDNPGFKSVKINIEKANG